MTTFEITSITIALCAFVITIWQGVSSRRHNRLSVEPNLETHVSSSTQENGWIRLAYILRNTGIGPGRLKSICLIRGEDKLIMETLSDVQRIAKQIFSDVEYEIRRSSYPGYDAVIKAGEDRLILEVLVNPATPPNSATDLNDYLNQYESVVEYESFYRKKFLFDSAKRNRGSSRKEHKAS